MKTITIDINFDVPANNDVTIRLNGTRMKLVPDEQTHNTETQTGLTNDSNILLSTHIERLISQLREDRRLRSAEIYRCALHSLQRFLPGGDITLADIDATLMKRYEHFLQNRGLTPNTTSFYMRVTRTIYRIAVRQGLTIDRHPFDYVATGHAATVKRAVGADVIRRILQLDALTPLQTLARDLFLFSFYTRGMAFVDMAYLRKSDLSNGVLTYYRHKTGQRLTVRWEQPMQDIVDRYPDTGTGYLLPIIKRNNQRERGQYRHSHRIVNAQLNAIGRRLGLQQPLTTYVARHSWASIARTMDVPIAVISEAMGHTSEHTTRIYLKTLDTKRLDNLNRSIIQLVANKSVEV